VTIARTGVALLLWAAVLVLVAAIVGGGETTALETNHASLVIVFPDGRTQTMCIEFDEESISGAELLQQSGLDVVFAGSGGLGDAICKIEDVGCDDPGNCWCQCSGGDCNYWTYFSLNDEGQWRYQPVGASQRTLRDGDVDAWVWGSGRAPPAGTGAAEGCGPTSQEPDPPEGPTATRVPQRPRSIEPPAEAGVQDVAPQIEQQTAGASGGPNEGPPGPRDPTEADTPQAAVGPRSLTSNDSVDGDGEPTPQATLDVDDEGGGGVPAELIAFGVVAGVLVAGMGAFALRRRLSG